MRFGAGGMLAGSLVVCAPPHAQSAEALQGHLAAEPSSSLRLHATSCPVLTKAAFSIQALHEPIDVAMNFTLSEIIHLAAQTGWRGNHRPLGFSTATTGYKVVVEADLASERHCLEPIKVSVSVMLTDRHIEIAKDLSQDPNCLSLARHHYILQAASNDAVLTQFAEGLAPILSRLTLPNLQHDGALPGEDRGHIEQVVRATIDRVWPSFQAALRTAPNGVDTEDEVANLTQTCPPAGGVTPRFQAGATL